jgi:hypothetical protein
METGVIDRLDPLPRLGTARLTLGGSDLGRGATSADVAGVFLFLGSQSALAVSGRLRLPQTSLVSLWTLGRSQPSLCDFSLLGKGFVTSVETHPDPPVSTQRVGSSSYRCPVSFWLIRRSNCVVPIVSYLSCFLSLVKFI